MTRPSLSVDFRNAAALDGEDSPWFGGEEEDESDESALAENTAAYGSLTGLGGGRKKKAMALVLDPIEAENEARRVQHIAAQQFGCEDEVVLPEAAVEPAAFDEPYIAPALDVWAEPAMDEPAMEIEEPVYEVPAERELPPAIEPAAEPAREPDDFWVFSDDGADDLAEAPAAAIEVAVPVAVEPAPPAAEPQSILPPPVPPVVSRPGHGLRARIPQQKQRRSFGQHLVAVIGWLAKRFSRGE